MKSTVKSFVKDFPSNIHSKSTHKKTIALQKHTKANIKTQSEREQFAVFRDGIFLERKNLIYAVQSLLAINLRFYQMNCLRFLCSFSFLLLKLLMIFYTMFLSKKTLK